MMLLFCHLLSLYYKMQAFATQLLRIFNQGRCFSSLSLRRCASMCAGSLKPVYFCRQSDLLPVSRACHYQLIAPTWHDLPRRYSTLYKTHCDVHRFGELRLTVGSSCDVAVSSLHPELYIDQNLVIVTDIVSRLSVDYHNSEGVSHVSISESKDSQTRKQSGQQSDVCNIQVPIKYGSLSFSDCICFTVTVA